MIVDPDFLDHWKTRMLVGLLETEEAPLYVLRLWAHCQQRRQCEFDNLPDEALKALCRFPGHANKLAASLATSGFVRREGEALVVVKWRDYNASLIAAWENGKKGGRPKSRGPGAGNPRGSPGVNPAETHGLTSREEKSRGERKRARARISEEELEA